MPISVAVLRLRDFRVMLFVRLFSLMAMQAQAVIVGWQIYTITKSAFMLGLVGLTEAVPAITCALFAGHIADICRPHRVLLCCMGALAFNMLLFLLFAGEIIHISESSLVPLIFICVFISGVARSFAMPSSFALQPQIVPRNQFSAATAWLSGFFQIAVVIGPALAGLIFGGYGSKGAWFMPVCLMTMAFLILTSVSHKVRHYKSPEKREPAVKSIKEGYYAL